ncbi:hypothetical protein MKW98_002781 [Papaver atlanticum]|uniref:Uncharacterized protein n=1 Tax=Papaver atlanticum TaxID=357466 RepID=A0AAD4THE4_9MAGN|nr:hypothetical protein MKW98_002781 [Papaver atlanticum]
MLGLCSARLLHLWRSRVAAEEEADNSLNSCGREVDEMLQLDMARTESWNKETEAFIFNLFSPKWLRPFTE